MTGVLSGFLPGLRLPARERGGLAGAALLAALLAGCAGEQAVVMPAAVTVPAEAPRTTGARERPADGDHAKLVAAFGGEVQAPATQRFLTEITERLVKAGDRPDRSYAVTILDSGVVNAFALPNGRLYVTRGLLALANDTPFGLNAAVFSADRDRAIAVGRRIRAGQVQINDGAFNIHAPFGGYKQSGNGREFGAWGLDDYLETKSMQLP
mgnify:CR=1 FL=1